MEFFLDTANLDEIKQATELGLIDGVTTNPTLLSREGGDWVGLMKNICSAVKGPVSLELVKETINDMIVEAEELASFGDNVVIKVPMTQEGLVVVRRLAQKGIRTNVTLIFTPMQALLAAKAGATYVSPFVGRLDGIGEDGMGMIEQLRIIFDNYQINTKILVASIRHANHVLESALLGADVATVPFAVITDLMKHPLTDKGLAAFKKDWESLTHV
ncbi:MAG: fructose-6-phosphate aldolase [Desulfovibrio sp.]